MSNETKKEVMIIQEAIRQKLLEAKRLEEQNRMKASYDRLLIYYDDYEDQVLELLKTQFAKENFARMKFMVKPTVNVLKRVVKLISTVYIPPPTRTLESEPQTQLLNEIYKAGKFNKVLKTANRLLNVVNDIILKPTWRSNKLELDIITPNLAFVLQNEEDPTKADAVVYLVEYEDDPYNPSKRWIYWDDASHFILDEDLRPVFNPYNPDNINPYGKMPFVFIHLDQETGRFWNTTAGQDLVNITLTVAVKKALKDYMFKQMMKQLGIETDDFETATKVLGDQVMDPVTPLLLPGRAQVLDFQVNLEALARDIQGDIEQVITQYGISWESWTLSSKGELSGRALKIRNRRLEEIRTEQIEIFREAEQDLYQIVALIWNKHNPGKKLNEEAVLKVDFAEHVIEPDPKEEREELEWLLEKGFISPGQVYMRFNPDIKTEEEAEERVKENLSKLKNWQTWGFLENIFKGKE